MSATSDPVHSEKEPATPVGHYNPASDVPPEDASQPVSRPPGALEGTGGRSHLDSRPPVRQGGVGKWILLVVIIAAAIIGGVLWRKSGEHSQLLDTTRDLSVQYVNVTNPTAGSTESEIVLPGNLMAFNEASIYARTSGYLKVWYTDIGANVTEGQVLAEIEAPDIDAQLRQSKASLAQAKANLEIANLNFDRQKDLLAKKVASQQEFDQNRTNVDAMKSAVQAAEAAVQNLTVQQNFQKLIAPFAGVVTKRSTDVGALITAGGSQELFRVARTDILRVYVYVPQAYAGFVKVDSKAFLEFAEYPGEKFQGKVANIAGAIDPATRTLQTEVQVDNKQDRLFPGAFANTHLSLPLKKAPTVIPVNALLFRKEGTQVAEVGADGIVHLKSVTIGQDFGTTLEIASGVTQQDQIIVNPSDSLADGAKVQIATPKAAASPAR